mmetsp:Transcript_95057/g.307668  ORF Transcript_95057/g.307668 Transcript_95057/m.307668 type:complete len:202 (-) Transcript_95057:282-887(-)
MSPWSTPMVMERRRRRRRRRQRRQRWWRSWRRPRRQRRRSSRRRRGPLRRRRSRRRRKRSHRRPRSRSRSRSASSSRTCRRFGRLIWIGRAGGPSQTCSRRSSGRAPTPAPARGPSLSLPSPPRHQRTLAARGCAIAGPHSSRRRRRALRGRAPGRAPRRCISQLPQFRGPPRQPAAAGPPAGQTSWGSCPRVRCRASWPI